GLLGDDTHPDRQPRGAGAGTLWRDRGELETGVLDERSTRIVDFNVPAERRNVLGKLNQLELTGDRHRSLIVGLQLRGGEARLNASVLAGVRGDGHEGSRLAGRAVYDDGDGHRAAG